MSITHGDLDRAVLPAGVLRNLESEFYASDPQAKDLTEAIDTASARVDPGWQELCHRYALTDVEAELLAVTAAAQFAPDLKRAYAYLLDETSPCDATTALVSQLWMHDLPARIGEWSSLIRWGLAQPSGIAPVGSADCGWRADPSVLDDLLGIDSDGLYLGEQTHVAPPVLLFPDLADAAITFLRRGDPDRAVVVELVGPPGAGKTVLASQTGQKLGRGAVLIDSVRAMASLDPRGVVLREVRRASRNGTLLIWQHADSLSIDLMRLVVGQGLTILEVNRPVPSDAEGDAMWLSMTLPAPGRDACAQLWRSISDTEPPPQLNQGGVSPREIVALAATRGEPQPGVGRRRLADLPADLLEPIPLHYTWDDLVVSEHVLRRLRFVETRARHRDHVFTDWGLRSLSPVGVGVTALFAGPSGTGKTMAAQVIAGSLGLALYRVDLAGTVSKYIGETEQHLRAIFDACERAPVVLLFDEADALFGKRTDVKDAHDRFANIEIAYLLQRLERYEGVAILTTNRRADLDEAFLRRIAVSVDFAMPDAEARTNLWTASLGGLNEGGPTIEDGVDWRALGEDLEMTPAAIKLAALDAAFQASGDHVDRISRDHVWEAVRHQQDKRGEVIRPGRLAPRESR